MRTRSLMNYGWLPLTAACVLAAIPARAQMPLHPPEMRTIFPLGVAQGSAVKVLVDGQNVSDPSAVAIGGEGVTATVVRPEGAPPTVGLDRSLIALGVAQSV